MGEGPAAKEGAVSPEAIAEVAPGRPVAERIASYLAGGSPQRADVQRAADILVLIQEPDPEMAAAGDAAVWRRMIDAALVTRWDAQGALAGPAADP